MDDGIRLAALWESSLLALDHYKIDCLDGRSAFRHVFVYKVSVVCNTHMPSF